MVKRCSKCKLPKDRDDFNKDKSRKDGLFPWCRKCHKAHSNQYRKKVGKDEINRKQAAFRQKRASNEEAHALHLKKSRLYMLKHRYGVTSKTLVALMKAQGSRCAICHKPHSKRGRGLCLDHDHESGQPRGFLCDGCNTGLGFFQDNPKLLRRAIAYLKCPPATTLTAEKES